MANRVSRQLRSLRKAVESELEEDPDEPRRFSWRLRRS
jgi:hypothetical protein